jgi:hypothetical protein
MFSTGTGLLQEWPEGGPPLLWRVGGIGEGIACASIAEGRSYATGFHEQGELLTAFDRHTGQWLDRPKAACERRRVLRGYHFDVAEGSVLAPTAVAVRDQ